MTTLKPKSGWKEGPWLIHGEETEFDNPWIKLVTYPVTMPNSGEPGTYGVVRFKNIAVGVLPLDDQGYTWIVGQHRFPLNQYSWELPEGGGALDVDTRQSALRELEEETGLVASTLLPLGEWHVSNCVTDEKAVAYIATDLGQGTVAPDPGEVLELKRVKFTDILDMVVTGGITDAFTVLMVQTAYIKAGRGDLPDNIARHLLAKE